jgi:PAS domain-containing protein
MIERRSVLRWAVAAGALALVIPAGTHDFAGLAVLVAGPAIPRTLRGLVAAIVVGTAAIGAIAAGVVTAVGGPLSPTVAAGVGAAVGGGVGSAVWLFVAADDAEEETDVSIDVGEAAPAPQPADLFEANPDPILFVGGPDPSVLAANPAFGEVFGVDPDDVAGRPLVESLHVETESDAIAAAVAAGRAFEATVACETAEGPGNRRVRVVPTGGAHGAAYVVYGPVEAAG